MRQHRLVRRLAARRRRRSAATSGTSRGAGRRPPGRGRPSRPPAPACPRRPPPTTRPIRTRRRRCRAASPLAAAAGAGQRSPRRQQLVRGPREPGVRALAREDVGHVLDNLGVEQILPASAAPERRDGHAPDALARQAPVGARLDHAADAVLAPGGDPLRPRDLGERAVAQRLLVAASPRRANHCSVARKMIGLWQRQQCGYWWRTVSPGLFSSKPAPARSSTIFGVGVERRACPSSESDRVRHVVLSPYSSTGAKISRPCSRPTM